jgi:hypothetical protein
MIAANNKKRGLFMMSPSLSADTPIDFALASPSKAYDAFHRHAFPIVISC